MTKIRLSRGHQVALAADQGKELITRIMGVYVCLFGRIQRSHEVLDGL